MKLKSIQLKNFRCFQDSGIIPIQDMTIFVGENDCGKSSILKALSIFFGNEKQVQENFRKVGNSRETSCEVELVFQKESGDLTEDFKEYLIDNEVNIRKIYSLSLQGIITEEAMAKKYSFTKNDLNDVKNLKADGLKSICAEFKLKYEGVDAAKEKISNYLKEHFETLDKKVEYTQTDWSKVYLFLPSFELYDSSNLAEPHVLVASTLKSIYRSQFYDTVGNAEKLKATYQPVKDQIEKTLNEHIAKNLKELIMSKNSKVKDVTGKFTIDFASGFKLDTFMIDLGQGENPLNSIGEGSRKLLFLAINEWDSGVRTKLGSKRVIRGYDEPDASLHYTAQKQMFYSLYERTKNKEDKIQALICTHSIAMVDRAPANIINYVECEDGRSKISYLKDNNDKEIKDFLDSVSEISGIRNSSLFFERCFLIVEGETEDNFLPPIYRKMKNSHALQEDGIVLINIKGNSAWQPFLKLLNKNKAACTVLMLDSDAQTQRDVVVTPQKLAEIGFPAEFIASKVFLVGRREFEDIFSDEIICRCLNRYWPKIAGAQWTPAEIARLRDEPKFSEALKQLVERYRIENAGVTYKPFRKPEFGSYMAEVINKTEFENIQILMNLMTKLAEIIA